MQQDDRILAAPARATRQRRGMALMMVLTVVSAAAILAWAMLASSSMRAQVDDNAVDAVEAVSIAESGVSYAMHCLHYPERVRPNGADATTWFYPGELGFKPWSDARGTADITVTSTGTNKYRIQSIASVTRGSNLGAARHTVLADVTTQLQGVVDAAGFNGGISIPSNMHIVGPVISSGAVSGFSTQVTNSPPLVVASGNVIPPASQVALLIETGVTSTVTGALSTDRTYTYNGNTYIAEKAPNPFLGNNSTRPTLNPCNVFYSDTSIALNGGVTFTGVLVLRNTAVLTVSGTNTLTAPPGMPVIVANSNIELKSALFTTPKLYANGAVWVGNKIGITSGTTDKSAAVVSINGALLMGGVSPRVDVAAAVDVTYQATTVGDVRRLSTVPTISGVTIERWQSTD